MHAICKRSQSVVITAHRSFTFESDSKHNTTGRGKAIASHHGTQLVFDIVNLALFSRSDASDPTSWHSWYTV